MGTSSPSVTFSRRRLGGLLAGTAAAIALPAPRVSAAARCSPRGHTSTEYRLPRSKQTHEIVWLRRQRLALISQQDPSRIVKVRFADGDERVTAVAGFPAGAAGDGVHGLALSRRHPGLVWATLEHANALLLLDPRAQRISVPPRVVRRIDLPPGAEGPHYVGEYGDELWVSLKAGNQVMRLDLRDPRRPRFYDTPEHPIFIARHPVTGDLYASIDESSRILRVSRATGRAEFVDTAAAGAIRPVGLIAGPARALWFACAGSPSSGTGMFGRIDAGGRITYYRLRSPLTADAALLHLAFDPPRGRQPATMWLLSSSIVDPAALDLVIRVRFEPGYRAIRAEKACALPTQRCAAHRLLLLPRTVVVTELASSTLAQLGRAGF